MDTPQTTPTRFVPFVIMVAIFWAGIGVLTVAHSVYMSSFETPMETISEPSE